MKHQADRVPLNHLAGAMDQRFEGIKAGSEPIGAGIEAPAARRPGHHEVRPDRFVGHPESLAANQILAFYPKHTQTVAVSAVLQLRQSGYVHNAFRLNQAGEAAEFQVMRSEERRVGIEGVSTGRSRRWT